MTMLDVFRSNRPNLLTRTWEPFNRDFDQVFRDLDRAMLPIRGWAGENYDFMPACDIDETEDCYHFTVDVPGLDEDEIQVEVVGHSVRISGERHKESEEKGRHEYRLERSYGKFSRSFTLPEGVNEDDIEANYENGVLQLTIPKMKKSKAKKISVKSGKGGIVEKLSGKGKKKAVNH